MSVLVDEGTVGAAYERAARLTLSDAERRRWTAVLQWARENDADPTPGRAAELRKALYLSDETVDSDVLAEAGRLLGAEDATDARAEEVYRRCFDWLAADVNAAAPLLALFTGHHRDPEAAPAPVDPDLVRRLQDWLSSRAGPDARIESVNVISGGFSRLMLDLRWTGGRGVVRVEQDGLFGTDGAREVAVLQAVRAAGYPVPAVLWQEPDAAVLGQPFLVMEFVAGAARTDETGIEDMLRSLADLHRLDRDVVDRVAALDAVPAHSPPEAAIDAQLRHWRRVYRAAAPQPIPLLERGFGWLRRHLRPTGPSVIVHGDPGPGNALQDANGVRAVIDWEFAHVGDAAEDWAYLALIRGRKLAGPQEWQDRIRTAVGVSFDDADWLAWEVYNNVKGACVNLTALDVFARTARPSPDLLAIGVAVHLRFLQRVVELTRAFE